jgi:tetratricopeptide (TPR) repeat protein
MSSLIPGYNYDIFISYRQKDNKHDGWVTKFVESLKGELDATFKEDISIYFDENPHDRLKETHNVDKSLEGKLKCLIFIPILSQTYCDPNSYAWQSEFLAFIKLAEGDRFGKDVKLRSGNVASRILPVRIHDLEPEDIKLFEKETGSVLRAMDFVFKTASGVNRPLLPEDDRNENLNKTLYRDQINKVAGAIKEIILGMKEEPFRITKGEIQPQESFKEVMEDDIITDSKQRFKGSKIRYLIPSAIATLLIIAGIITYPKIFRSDTLERLRASGERISVAVMPFQNMTNDTIWNVWQSGIQDILVSNLSNSPEELKVRQMESINDLIRAKGFTNYATITPSVARNISQKLEADIFVYGSIKQVGNVIRLNAQLIDSKTEDVFKSFQIDGVNENILHMVDSLTVMVKNFLIISKIEKRAPAEYWRLSTTNSPEAFRLFISGQSAFYKRDFNTASKLFIQALTIDSNFTHAALSLSFAYANMGYFSGNVSLYDDAKKLCIKLYRRRDQMPPELKIRTNRLYAILFETPTEEIQYLNQLKELDDQSPSIHFNFGVAYSELFQYDRAIPEFEKSLEIYKKREQKPLWDVNYLQLGNAYHETGQYKKERSLYERAEQDFPDDPAIIRGQAILALTEGDTITADKFIEKFISARKVYSFFEINNIASLANLYLQAGILNKAEKYYRELLSQEPENPRWMNNLAWLLIDHDRNIEEGLEIIEKALELSPYDSNILDTKGLGLYKQGKYMEALELLQKADSLKPIYSHEIYLHLEAAKKAVAEHAGTLN